MLEFIQIFEELYFHAIINNIIRYSVILRINNSKKKNTKICIYRFLYLQFDKNVYIVDILKQIRI